MKNERIKNKAIAMRKDGMSHLEISKALKIAKSTSSLWTRNVDLPFNASQLLILKSLKGREKGRRVRTLKVESRNQVIKARVIEEISKIKLNKSYVKLLVAILYWGEGSKTSKRITFTNSDQYLVKAFISLFRYCYNLKESKFSITLHLHNYHNVSERKRFWSNLTGIPIEKIHVHQKKILGKIKRLEYPGCVAINYNDVVKFEELSQVYKNFDLVLGGLV